MRPWHVVAWCTSLGLAYAVHSPELQQQRLNIDVVVGRNSGSGAVLGGAAAFFATNTYFGDTPSIQAKLLAKLLNASQRDFNVHHDYIPFATVLQKCEMYAKMDPPAPITRPEEVSFGSVSVAERTELLCGNEEECGGSVQAAYMRIKDTLAAGHLYSTQNPIVFAGCRKGGLYLGAIASVQTYIIEDVHTESYCRVTKLYETPNHFEVQLQTLKENLVVGLYYYRVEMLHGAISMTIEKEQILNSWLLRGLNCATLDQYHQTETANAVENYMEYFRALARGRKPPESYVKEMFRGRHGEECKDNGECLSADCQYGVCQGGMACPLLYRRAPPKERPPAMWFR